MRRALAFTVAACATLFLLGPCSESEELPLSYDDGASAQTVSGVPTTNPSSFSSSSSWDSDAPPETLMVAMQDRTLSPRSRSDAPAPLVGSTGGCPGEMIPVEGEYCTEARQDCLEWMDPPDSHLPHHRCSKFAPSVCVGQRVSKRFCIDRDEYVTPGESLPTSDLSWTDSQKICNRMGKRLCFESEWQFACEGEQMLPYPYGYERDSQRCNHDKSELVDAKGHLRDYRMPPGELRTCVSPFGVRNMIGNVDEWVYRDGFVHPWRSGLKGGWWLAGRNRCRPATTAHNEYYHEVQTGFRCCRDIP